MKWLKVDGIELAFPAEPTRSSEGGVETFVASHDGREVSLTIRLTATVADALRALARPAPLPPDAKELEVLPRTIDGYPARLVGGAVLGGYIWILEVAAGRRLVRVTAKSTGPEDRARPITATLKLTTVPAEPSTTSLAVTPHTLGGAAPSREEENSPEFQSVPSTRPGPAWLKILLNLAKGELPELVGAVDGLVSHLRETDPAEADKLHPGLTKVLESRHENLSKITETRGDAGKRPQRTRQCSNCVHLHRRPDDVNLFFSAEWDINDQLAEQVSALGTWNLLENDVKVHSRLKNTAHAQWPHLPLIASVCMAADDIREPFVPEVKNANNDCADYDDYWPRVASDCRNCEHREDPYTPRKHNLRLNPREMGMPELDLLQRLTIEQAQVLQGRGFISEYPQTLPVCTVYSREDHRHPKAPQWAVPLIIAGAGDCQHYKPIDSALPSTVDFEHFSIIMPCCPDMMRRGELASCGATVIAVTAKTVSHLFSVTVFRTLQIPLPAFIAVSIRGVQEWGARVGLTASEGELKSDAGSETGRVDVYNRGGVVRRAQFSVFNDGDATWAYEINYVSRAPTASSTPDGMDAFFASICSRTTRREPVSWQPAFGLDRVHHLDGDLAHRDRLGAPEPNGPLTILDAVHIDFASLHHVRATALLASQVEALAREAPRHR